MLWHDFHGQRNTLTKVEADGFNNGVRIHRLWFHVHERDRQHDAPRLGGVAVGPKLQLPIERRPA